MPAPAKVARFRVLIAYLLWLLPTAAFGQVQDESGLPPGPDPMAEEEAEPSPALLQLAPGYYDVLYTDTMLGLVVGETLVAEDGSLTVTYRHPATGETFVLRGDKPRVEGDTLVIPLDGRSPHGPRVDGSEWPGRWFVAKPDEPIKVIAGEKVYEHPLQERAPSDADKVELRLQLAEDGSLSGTWSYRADPVTFRDRGGYGRLGLLVEQDGVLMQIGSETWARQGMVIFGALVVHDQTGLDRLRWDYPFDTRFTPPGQQDKFWFRRTMIVYGRNLPKTPDDPVEIAGDDPTIDYELWGLDADQFRNRGGPDPGVLARDFQMGRERLLARLPPEEHAEARKMDALLVRVTLKEGVVPGWHDFTINGKAVRWQLLFSNVRGEIAFVRPVGAGFEASHEFLLPETIYIEVRVPAITALEEIPVAMSVDGNYFSFDGEPTIPAYRIGLASLGEESLLRDLKEGPPPLIYRTGPLQLTNLPEPDAIELRPGRKLHARVVHAGVLQGASGLAEALIIKNTSDPLADRNIGPWPSGEDLWEMALERAAKCHFTQSNLPWRGRENLEVDKLGNLIVTEAEFRTLSVDLGDHAAMLLLRDGFVALMRHQIDAFAAMKGDAAVLGFRSFIREAALSANLPLGKRLVSAPDGSRRSFELTFNLERARSLLGMDADEASLWVLAATREFMASYLVDLRNSLAIALNTGECDLKALLFLTGFGFDPVERLLLPWLMLPDVEGGVVVEWTPDFLARAYVVGLPTLAEAAKDQEALSNIDTQVVLLVASAVAVPAAYFQAAWLGHLVAHGALGARTGAYASYAISTFGLAVDIADLTQIVIKEIPEGLRSREEARFALGASAVLGTGRLLQAEAEKRSWAGLAATALLGGYGLYRGVKQFDEIPDVYQFARWGKDYLAIRRGANLIGRFADTGLAGLTRRQRRDLYKFLEDVQTLRAVAGANALTALQRQGLEAFDKALSLQRQIGDRPTWLLLLDDATQRAVVPMLNRPDVAQLLRSEEASVAIALLQGPLRNDVLRMMRSYPVPTAADLAARLAAYRGRVRDAVPGLYALADLGEAGETVALLQRGGTYVRVQRALPGQANSVTFWLAKHPLDQVKRDGRAVFTRSYDQGSGTLVFSQAFLNDAPQILTDLPINLLPGQGTPTAALLNLAALRHFGIGFAGSGSPLNVLRMSEVINAENNFHLQWLLDTYGSLDRIPQEALRELFSVKYAESALNQAGYEIARIRIVSEGTPSSLLIGKVSYKTSEEADAAVRLYFGEVNPPKTQRYIDEVTIDIDVRPITR